MNALSYRNCYAEIVEGEMQVVAQNLMERKNDEAKGSRVSVNGA